MALPNPGNTLLQQYLRPRKLSQNALARALGVPPRRINEIILGKRAISADTAVRLGIYFGNSAAYWMHLQSEFDIGLAREKIGPRLNIIRPAPLHEETARPSNRPAMPSSAQHNIKKRIMR